MIARSVSPTAPGTTGCEVGFMPDTIRFHVFLSHCSADKPAVEEIGRRLKLEGLEPWLDKWNLIPGDAWQPAIEDALRGCATCAVFIGCGGFGACDVGELVAMKICPVVTFSVVSC